MNKLDLYHRLPYPVKTLAASAWGYYLKWWRYDAQTEQRVGEILERDSWSPEKWKNWQEERLAFILNRAAKQVPYYRASWNERRRKGDRSSWEVLANWPLLNKEEIRQKPLSFVAEDVNPKMMYMDHTGGTTGTPLNVYLTRDTVNLWYAMYEARIRRWNNVSNKDRWIMLGGQMVIPIKQKKSPFWVYNKGLNQLYLSTFHISKQTINEYVKKINQFQPTHWVVYPSSAALLSQLILEEGLDVNSPAIILTNAEPLWQNQKELISKAFKCPVLETYGMGEIVLAASECHYNKLHYWPDSGVLEIFDDNMEKIQDKNFTGNIVATGLINQNMPLIRYQVGDRGQSPLNNDCNCGKNLPEMLSIEGRSSDLILTPDGRKIFWMNPVFYGLPIQEAQIIQEKIELIRVKVLPATHYSFKIAEEIEKRIQDRIGSSVEVVVEVVSEIPRTKAGKFKAVVSNLDQDNHKQKF